jgi:hypothetical protein
MTKGNSEEVEMIALEMEMSRKDRNIRGICPELHFFGFLHSKISPI